jgi:hypothetical protein
MNDKKVLSLSLNNAHLVDDQALLIFLKVTDGRDLSVARRFQVKTANDPNQGRRVCLDFFTKSELSEFVPKTESKMDTLKLFQNIAKNINGSTEKPVREYDVKLESGYPVAYPSGGGLAKFEDL